MSDLLDVARKVAGTAREGEQLEAYVSRVRETEVKVHDANVESLVVAERAGVGVRVVVEGRQGFAWAGSLDDDVVDEALAAARDNAEFATPDQCLGLATAEDATGAVAELDLWRDDVVTTDTGDKVALALAAEAATRAADDKVRAVESASYGDGALEAAIATSTGVEAVGAADVVLRRVVRARGRGHRDPHRLRLLRGPSVRRSRRRRGRA